ncbi:hypothetical protein F5141DRAFT_1070070 [Pisolithus sp. B1]|nr:hypothetical protein F5141DRAFT_1070070 [Pisolithus sp. B1]
MSLFTKGFDHIKQLGVVSIQFSTRAVGDRGRRVIRSGHAQVLHIGPQHVLILSLHNFKCKLIKITEQLLSFGLATAVLSHLLVEIKFSINGHVVGNLPNHSYLNSTLSAIIA